MPVVLLPLPWWTAPRSPVLLTGVGPAAAGTADGWSGWELAGPLAGAVLGALVVAGAVLLGLRRTRPAAAVLVVAGAAGVAVGTEVLLSRGASLPAGIAIACGGLAAVLAALDAPVLLAAALLAAAVPVLPGGAPAPEGPRTAGPFVRVADLGADDLRGGATALPGTGATAVVVDGRPGVATAEGLAVVGPDGRADVRARTPDGPPERAAILGVARGRVVRWSAADALTVTGLDPGDPVAVTVRGVAAASRPGADGTVWVRATADPPGAVRLLDLSARDGLQTADATYLPVVAINGPAAGAPVDVTDVVPDRSGAFRAVAQEAGHRLERLSGTPAGGTEVAHLAGGLDATCGLTASGRDSFLPGPGPLAADGAGGVWLVTGPAPGGRLARLEPGGALRVVAAPPPGVVSSLVTGPDGEVVLVLDDGLGPALWQLPDPAAALIDLPPPPAGCTAHPGPVAPPVDLVPVARPGRDPLGVPLGADGRWASAGPGGEVAVVAAGTRRPLGTRTGEAGEPVWPDGSGGVWWLERAGPSVALVHTTPAGEQRFPPVPDPAPGGVLVPDLGGRPPLLATAAGAFRIDSGAPVQVATGRVTGGVVRADGRGWLLTDGGLLTLDGDRVLEPVIDPGPRRDDVTPASVQLADGVAPAALALPRAAVALDPAGRALVVADDVMLAVGDGGDVRVVAQDRRLAGLALFAAEGGPVVRDRGDLLRVDLP